MEGIEKKNYVALIYMPKQTVNFDFVSYMITIDKTAEFNIVLSNNGSVISLTKGEGEDWSSGDDSSAEEERNELTYKFDSAKNLNQTAAVCDVINSNELDKFTKPTSLFEVVNKAANYEVYLKQITNENGDDVRTFKEGNMCVLFETDVEFSFNEELSYEEK